MANSYYNGKHYNDPTAKRALDNIDKQANKAKKPFNRLECQIDDYTKSKLKRMVVKS